jgi:hypothetical protein
LTGVNKGVKNFQTKLASVVVGQGLRLPKTLILGETLEIKEMAINMRNINGAMHGVNNQMKGLGLEMISISETLNDMISGEIFDEMERG